MWSGEEERSCVSTKVCILVNQIQLSGVLKTMSFKCVEKMLNVKDKISGKYVVKDCQLMQSISTCCMSFSQLTHSLNFQTNIIGPTFCALHIMVVIDTVIVLYNWILRTVANSLKEICIFLPLYYSLNSHISVPEPNSHSGRPTNTARLIRQSTAI